MAENDNLSVFQRIDMVVKYTHLSVVDFAKSINRTTQFYYEFKRGARSRDHMSRKLAVDICEIYKEINIEWLLYGIGDMIIPTYNDCQKSGDRLERIRVYLHTSLAKMADDLDIDKHILYNIKNGVTQMTSGIAKSICDKYPMFCYEWVYTGEGEMLKTNNNTITNNNGAIMQGVVGDNNTQNVGNSDMSQQLIEALKKINEQQERIHELEIELLKKTRDDN